MSETSMSNTIDPETERRNAEARRLVLATFAAIRAQLEPPCDNPELNVDGMLLNASVAISMRRIADALGVGIGHLLVEGHETRDHAASDMPRESGAVASGRQETVGPVVGVPPTPKSRPARRRDQKRDGGAA